jgi:hypothetical protein
MGGCPAKPDWGAARASAPNVGSAENTARRQRAEHTADTVRNGVIPRDAGEKIVPCGHLWSFVVIRGDRADRPMPDVRP